MEKTKDHLPKSIHETMGYQAYHIDINLIMAIWRNGHSLVHILSKRSIFLLTGLARSSFFCIAISNWNWFDLVISIYLESFENSYTLSGLIGKVKVYFVKWTKKIHKCSDDIFLHWKCVWWVSQLGLLCIGAFCKNQRCFILLYQAKSYWPFALLYTSVHYIEVF